MANENELSDNYVFRASLEDDVSANAGKVSESLDQVGNSADSAKVALDQINQAQAAVAAGLDKVATAGTVGTRSFQNLQRTIDPYTAALNRQMAAQEQLNRLYDQGKIGIDTYGRLQQVSAANIEAAEAKLQNYNKTLASSNELHGQAQFAVRQAQVQMLQFVSSVASGAPVMTAFIQQGHQLVDVAAVTGTGFGTLARAVSSAVSAIGGWPVAAAAAIAVGLGLIAKSAEDVAEKRGALASALSGTRDDYVSMATTIDKTSKALASQIGQTADDIVKAQTIIATRGHFQGTAQDLAQVTKDAAALATVMQTDLPAAARIVAQAMLDPIAAVKELSKSPDILKTVSSADLELARNFALAGDNAKATSIILNDLNKAVQQQHENLTPLQQAWRDFEAAIHPVSEAVGELSKSLGTTLIEALTATVTEIKETIELFKEFYSEVGGLTGLISKLPIPSSGAGPGPQLTGNYGAPLAPGPYTSQMNLATQSTGAFGQSLFQALINAESSGNQYTQSGELLMAGGGGLPTGTLPGANQHVGLGQISPNVAAGFGFSAQDITTPAGNIGASAALFTHLYQKYGGDPTLVVAAYNWGEGNVDKFLGTGGSGHLPNETQSEIGKVLGTLYASGVQAPSGGFNPGARGPGAVIDVQSLPVPPIPPSGPSDATRALGQLAQAGNFGATNEQLKNLQDQLQKADALYQVFSHDLGAGSDAAKEQAGRIANLKDQIADLQDPQRQAVRDLQQSAAATGLLDEADQKLLEKQQQIANYNAQHQDQQITQAQATRALAAVQDQLTAEFSKRIAVLGQDTQLTQQQADAYNQSRQAANDNAESNAALLETMKSFSLQSPDFVQHWQDMTNAIKANRQAQEGLSLAKMTQDLRDQGSVLQLEISTLGQDNDSRNTMIDLLRTEIQIRSQFPDLSDQQVQGYLAEKKAIDDLNTTLQGRQRDIDFVANQISSSFDTIGNAIAQSFVEGQGAAVNFGNVMKSVAEQIIQAFLRLAVINPILNGLFGGAGGQTLPTLFSVANTLGGGPLSSGGGGILPTSALFGGGFLSQGIFGTSAAEAAGQSGVLESGLTFGAVPPQIGAGTGVVAPTGILGGASIGGLATGVLGGFGIGSLAGGQVQRSLGKTGPGPLAGAGTGALAGAAIGSIIPGIGTVIGGLIGGIVGGAGGGLIGPKAPSPYQATFVTIQDGKLVAVPGLSGNQLSPTNVQAAQNDANAFTQQANALGVDVRGTFAPPPAGAPGGLGFLGTAKNPAGIAGASISDVFSNIRFGAAPNLPPQSIDVLNRALERSFASFDELAKEVNKVRTFTEQTVPALEKYNITNGALNQTLQQIDQAFVPAIATAKELGYAEQELTDARVVAIKKAQDAAAEQLSETNAGLSSRYATAAAAISGDPQQILAAQLQDFDLQANQQRKQMSDSLVATYGDTIKSTSLYADEMANLEKTLGEERLATVKSANDAIKQSDDALRQQAQQAASQLVTSIKDYTHNLQYSQLSPLSPQAQLDAAQKQFNAVSGAARQGDANSLSQLTTYSDQLLGAARAVYGSGKGYVDVFNKVVDTLGAVSQISPDNLTASIFAQETKDQTTQIVEAVNSLQSEVKALRAQVAAGSSMPARLAA